MSSAQNSITTTPESSLALGTPSARVGARERTRRRLNASVIVLSLSALAASASAVALMVWATVGPL